MQPRTPLFVLLSVAVFAFLNVAFPVVAQQALRSSFTPGAGGLYGWFYALLWLVGSVMIAALCYRLFLWAFRQLAELTESSVLCRVVLIAGALLTAGALLIGLWRGVNATGTDALLPRLELTAIALAACAAAILATRYGPESFYYDYTDYRS